MNNPKKTRQRIVTGVSQKKDIQMSIKHKKRCSTFLMINEMQIKTAMKRSFSPIRFSIIQKFTKMKSNRHSHNSHVLSVEMQTSATSGEDTWAIDAGHVSKNNHCWKKGHLKRIYLKWELEYHRFFTFIGILSLKIKLQVKKCTTSYIF